MNHKKEKGLVKMEELKKKILEDGYVINENVLRVDSFLNHQIDVELFNKIADEFYERYKNKSINMIVTIEASGIGLAVVVAQKFILTQRIRIILDRFLRSI